MNGPQAWVLAFSYKSKMPRGKADYDAYEDDQRHAVADAALADLLAEPHDEGRTSGQGEDGHQDEARTGMEYQRLATVALRLQGGGDGRRLNDAEHDRQIARVLRDLAAAEFAFFLQFFEIREHHRHQLQDDRRRDVRHDAEREDREATQVAAAEQIENAQERARTLLENGFQHAPVDAWRGNVRADAIYGQQG